MTLQSSLEIRSLTRPSWVNPGFALFAYGFRPFFALAGLYAALGMVLWLGLYSGVVPLPMPDMVVWHGHEMVFGFALAGLSGFLLTAVPGWTGAPPLRGAPLAGLAGLWLAGRVAMLLAGALPAALVAIIDLAFLPALAFAVTRSLFGGRTPPSPRNLVFLGLLALLELADLLVHAEALGWRETGALGGLRFAIGIFLLLIVIVGGRIIPAFTRNALKMAGRDQGIRSFAALDGAAIVATLLAVLLPLLLETLFPEALPDEVPAGLALLAAALNGLRLFFWRPWRTLGNPFLAILHLGYLWLILGLALQGLSALCDAIPNIAALHAETAGAIATMLLAVMSRAALGHTGRRLAAHPVTVAAYGALTFAALLRVLAPFAAPIYAALLLAAGIAWTLAFLLFCRVYLPILLRPRADGQPG